MFSLNVSKILLNGLACLGLLLVSFVVVAAADDHFLNLKSSLIMSGSQVISDSSVQNLSLIESEHLVVQSPVKRLDNAVFIENKSYVKAIKNVLILKAPSASNIAFVSEYYEKLLQKRGKLAFQCQKRECGINSYWANTVLEEPSVKGRDSNQSFVSGFLSVDGKPYYVGVYVVKNSLRQVVAHITVLEFTSIPVDFSAYFSAELASTQTDKDLFKQGSVFLLESDLQDLTTDSLALRGVSGEFTLVVYSNNSTALSKSLEAKLSQRLDTAISKLNELDLGASLNRFIVGPYHAEDSLNDNEVWFRLFVH